MDLTPAETVEFAKLNASVIQPSQHGLNPYLLGLKIFEDIERRWDEKARKHPDEPSFSSRESSSEGAMSPGREKIFEVRETESDVSFLRNYLTAELVEELDLYVFQKEGNEWKITEKSWEAVRDQLVYGRINGGFPYLVVKDGNYRQAGELYIQHVFEGIELDLKYVEKTLPYVRKLWGTTVHLETVVENHPVLFSCGENKIERKFL